MLNVIIFICQAILLVEVLFILAEAFYSFIITCKSSNTIWLATIGLVVTYIAWFFYIAIIRYIDALVIEMILCTYITYLRRNRLITFINFMSKQYEEEPA